MDRSAKPDRRTKPSGIKIPEDLPSDPAEAFELGAEMGFRCGESSGRKLGYDARWREE